jgi:hypothetical protein
VVELSRIRRAKLGARSKQFDFFSYEGGTRFESVWCNGRNILGPLCTNSWTT